MDKSSFFDHESQTGDFDFDFGDDQIDTKSVNCIASSTNDINNAIRDQR